MRAEVRSFVAFSQVKVSQLAQKAMFRRLWMSFLPVLFQAGHGEGFAHAAHLVLVGDDVYLQA